MPTARAFEDLTILALDDGGGPFVDPREAAFPDASATLWTQADRRDPGSVRDGGRWLRFRCMFSAWRTDE